jgi:hypothetical protein
LSFRENAGGAGTKAATRGTNADEAKTREGAYARAISAQVMSTDKPNGRQLESKKRAVLRRVRVVRAGERLKAIATTYLDQEAPLR